MTGVDADDHAGDGGVDRDAEPVGGRLRNHVADHDARADVDDGSGRRPEASAERDADARDGALDVFDVVRQCGSGSELSRLLFVVDREKGRPAMIRDERITPRVAINDPGTHVTSPPEVTAAAGMNLLTHAIEAYFSRNAAPLTDALALDAVALVAEHLPRAVADGNDPKARGALAMAEQLAGIAYNSAGLGVADAIALSLTAQYDLPHGAINGALLPHVVALDVAERRSKARRLAETLGGSEPGRIPEALAEVARRAGAPLSLSALGLEEDVVYTSIGAILESPLLDLHPTVMTEERLVDIVVAAVSGAPPEVRASAR